MPAEVPQPSSLGSMPLEGAACTTATATVVRPPAPSAPAAQANEDRPQASGQTVYALEYAGRNNVYCSSVFCVSSLLAQGWKLSNRDQLAALVRELATGRVAFKHDPSDHFT